MATQINRRLIFSLRSSLHLHRPCLRHSISIFFYSSSTSKRSESNPTAEYLINQHQFSPEAAFKASSTVAYLKNPADSDLVLSFLKDMYYEDLVKFSIFGVSGNLMDAVEVEEQGIESEGRECYWRIVTDAAVEPLADTILKCESLKLWE